MTEKLKRNYLSKVLAGSFIFYAFSGLSALLNYIFYPIIGRLVSTGEYGEIQFLISMFTQLAVGFVVLNILAIIISVRAKNEDQQNRSIKTLNHISITLMLPVILIAITSLFLLRNQLGLSDVWAIIGLGIAVLVSIPFTTHIGKLQGNGQFVASGVVGIAGAAGKLIFAIILVVFGFGVAGAVIGVGLGTFVSYLLSLALDNNRKKYSKTKLHLKKGFIVQLAYIRHQALIAIVLMGALTIVSVLDSITSRIILSHTAAGQYAAVATASKTILAITTPLMWLALPEAVRHRRKPLATYLSLATVLGILVCAIVYVFSPGIIQLLTGVNPGIYSEYVVAASIAMILCALAFLSGAVMVCRGQLRITAYSLFVGAVLGCVAFGVIHHQGTLWATLAFQGVFSASVFIGGVFGLRRDDI